MSVRARVNAAFGKLIHCKAGMCESLQNKTGRVLGGVSLQPFSSLKELEIPLQALQRFSETDFKLIQLNWSKYYG